MKMNDYIVLCTSYNAAVSEWLRIRAAYPIWVNSSRHPLTLTSCTGVHYVFHSEQAGNRLRGLKGEFIGVEELEQHASSICNSVRCDSDLKLFEKNR